MKFMEDSSALMTLCTGILFFFLVKMDVGPIFLYKSCHYADHFALCISHYAGFGTHSKLSNFWVSSDSLWLEPLIGKKLFCVSRGSSF